MLPLRDAQSRSWVYRCLAQHPSPHGLIEPLQVANSLGSVRKLVGDPLIDRLGH